MLSHACLNHHVPVRVPTRSQEVRRKEDQSGGVGADEDEEGEDGHDGEDGDGHTRRKDATHYWNFCNGKLGPFLWNDVMTHKGGGDVSNIADIVIPDGAPGMGSSVPGGPGRRKTGGSGETSLDDVNRERVDKRKAKLSDIERKRQQENERAEVMKALVSVLKAQQQVDAGDVAQEPTVPGVDVPDRVSQASQRVLKAQKEKDELPEDCNPQVRACVELALSIRTKEMSALMLKVSESGELYSDPCVVCLLVFLCGGAG